MLFTWIIKTIPRSIRAFLALLIMVGSISLAFNGIAQLFVPEAGRAGSAALQIVTGLAIGLPATALFYYFQHMDDRRRHKQSELEVLNRYAESEDGQRTYRPNVATPVFSNHGGAIKSIEGEIQRPAKIEKHR